MAFNELYRRQVALLMRILPLVAEEQEFALKGGTAINLFLRNMPRLSVDIDLTYLPVRSREESLTAIDAAMGRITKRIRKNIGSSKIVEGRMEGTATKVFVHAGGVQTKIEVTPVLRGSLYQPAARSVSPAVEEVFGYAEIQVLSLADLYGGKFVAALDRQHPRDFFDVRDLLANEGIDQQLRRAFVVYLLSHNRPMHEVLSFPKKDITQEFERGFAGMTVEPVLLDELLAARDSLYIQIVREMPEAHRQMLISFEKGQPDWSLLGIPDAAELPAIKWRRVNLDKLATARRAELVEKLEQSWKERA
jgi:predicted nucleotidyltransferase component of viral defense system